MKLSLFFLRHGQSLYQSCKIISGKQHVHISQLQKIGTHELGLSGVGKMQCHEIANQIKHIKFDSIYSSDLKRCVETMNLIHGKLKEKPLENRICFTELLREKDAGDDKMKSYKESSSYNCDQVQRNQKVSNGESWQDVQHRAQTFINSLIMTHFQEDKLIKMPFAENSKFFELNKKYNNEHNKAQSSNSILPLFQFQLAFNYHYSQKSSISHKNILIITHGGFISELLIYLKHRKTKQFFEEVKIPQDISHENMSNQMHARNGSTFQLDVSLDETGIGWDCEVVMKNSQGTGIFPFAGMKHQI